MPIVVAYTTVVVGVADTPILIDREEARGRILVRIFNPGPVPYYLRWGQAAVIAGTPPMASGGQEIFEPIFEAEDWQQRELNGIVSAGAVSLSVMEVCRT